VESGIGDIGNGLRQAREQLGLTLKRAEAETRIRGRYLAALEDERWDELPGEAYVRGFLRSYASYLGLDGAQYLAAYRARVRTSEPPIAPAAVGAVRRTRPGVVTALIAVAALAAVGLGAWQLDGRSDAEPRVVSPTQTTPAPASEQAPARTEPSALVLRGVGSGSRLVVRIGGPGGKLAWRGTLRGGQTLRLGLGRALFIRAAAPQNLRATIGGKPQRIGRATDLVATPQGLRPRS
jgi:hypothetical protein